MQELLKKLNYRGNERIAVINSGEEFFSKIRDELNEVIIDSEIDKRYPYEFMLIFVSSVDEVEHYSSAALHNLVADGILWFCYPKKTSKKYNSGPERNRGWDSLNNAGLFGIRMVAIDKDWSALRFRNIKYIRSTAIRFEKQT